MKPEAGKTGLEVIQRPKNGVQGPDQAVAMGIQMRKWVGKLFFQVDRVFVGGIDKRKR